MAAPTDSITTENVVTSTSVDQELNLEALSNDLSRSDYAPDRFPGLVYRTNDPKAASLLFRSGEVVTTGAESEPAARGVLEILFGELDGLEMALPETPVVEELGIIRNITIWWYH